MPATATGRVGGMPEKAAASCSETESFGRVIVILVRFLFGFDLAGASDRGPVRNLIGDVLAELRWRHRHDIERLRGESVAQVGRSGHLVEFLVDVFCCGRWSALLADGALLYQR